MTSTNGCRFRGTVTRFLVNKHLKGTNRGLMSFFFGTLQLNTQQIGGIRDAEWFDLYSQEAWANQRETLHLIANYDRVIIC